MSKRDLRKLKSIRRNLIFSLNSRQINIIGVSSLMTLTMMRILQIKVFNKEIIENHNTKLCKITTMEKDKVIYEQLMIKFSNNIIPKLPKIIFVNLVKYSLLYII